MFSIPTISPQELAQRLAEPSPPLLLDVREPEEWQAGFIPGAVLIPLGHLRERLFELDPAQEIVVYCHLGGRSAAAADFLLRHRFRRVMNLGGGIAAWERGVSHPGGSPPEEL